MLNSKTFVNHIPVVKWKAEKNLTCRSVFIKTDKQAKCVIQLQLESKMPIKSILTLTRNATFSPIL